MMVAGVVKELGGKVFTDDLFGFNLGATVYTGKASPSRLRPCLRL